HKDRLPTQALYSCRGSRSALYTYRVRTMAAPLSDRRDLIADTAIATVAAAGLRGLTHRAVDTAAGLPAGSTSYYFPTRSALISACYRRLATLTVTDVDRWEERHGIPDPDSAAEALAALLHLWLTE